MTISKTLKKYNKFWFLGFLFFLLTSIGLAIGLLVVTNVNSKETSEKNSLNNESNLAKNLKNQQLNLINEILEYHKQEKENIFPFPYDLKTIETDLEATKKRYSSNYRLTQSQKSEHEKFQQDLEKKKKYLETGVNITGEKSNTIIEGNFLYNQVATKMEPLKSWWKNLPFLSYDAALEYTRQLEQIVTYIKTLHKFKILITTNTQWGEKEQNSILISSDINVKTWQLEVHLSNKELTEKTKITQFDITNDEKAKKVGFENWRKTDGWTIYLLKEKGKATIDNFDFALLINFFDLSVAFQARPKTEKEFKIQKLAGAQFKNSESGISYKFTLRN